MSNVVIIATKYVLVPSRKKLDDKIQRAFPRYLAGENHFCPFKDCKSIVQIQSKENASQ